jgi:AhpD family alkylhydroperoxidase
MFVQRFQRPMSTGHYASASHANPRENAMTDMTPRDRELVALGAAMGSNCASCIEYHIPKAREAGLTDQEIYAAIRQADLIRQGPARKTLHTVLGLLPCAADDLGDGAKEDGCGCETVTTGAAVESKGEGCGCS